MTPAGQWLVDHHHVIEAQVREISAGLSPDFYRQLPKLATGPFVCYLRVLGIACVFVAHTDSRFDTETLRRFVQAYQRVQPLTIGEGWVVAITLRIVLVENLRRIASRVTDNPLQRQEADWVDNAILRVKGPLEPALLAVLETIPPSPLHFTSVVRLVQPLRDQDQQTTAALLWLDEQLSDQGTTAAAIV